MLTRMYLLAAIAVVCFTQKSVEASALTYDFTGAFAEPLNGSTQFSGSFTINGNPPVAVQAGTPYVSEGGSDVSLTVNMGGQVFNFVNNSQNYTTAWMTGDTVVPQAGSGTGPASNSSWVEFSLGGAYQLSPNVATFAITFYDYGTAATSQAAQILGNLGTFNFDPGSSSVYTTVGAQGVNGWAEGQITSLTLVSAPEPSALAVFAVLGLGGAIGKHHRRRRRGPE